MQLLSGLSGKTGLGLATIISAIIAAIGGQTSIGQVEIIAGIGALQTIIGLIHKVYKARKAKQGV